MLPAVVLLASGCYYDVEAELYPGSFCDTTAVTFSANVRPIIQSNCAVPGCHVSGGSGPGDFTTYSGLAGKVQDGSFADRVFVQRNMPPSGALGSCDQNILKNWVDAGHPDN